MFVNVQTVRLPVQAVRLSDETMMSRSRVGQGMDEKHSVGRGQSQKPSWEDLLIPTSDHNTILT